MHSLADAPFPLVEPKPCEGCEVCRDFAEQRREARASFNWSRVSDMNVLMRRHHREVHE